MSEDYRRCKNCDTIKPLTEFYKNQYRCIKCQKEYSKYRGEMKKNKTVIGIISDTHIPFEHKDYLEFCIQTFKKWKVDKIVHIGDIVDCHAVSRHTNSTNAMSAIEEYELTKERLKSWYNAFPELVLIQGNHSTTIGRQLKELGIPDMYLRSEKDLYQMPEKWELKQDIVIDNVYYTHGIGKSGKYAAVNLAKDMMMSCVMGHTHSIAFCHYLKTPTNRIFGMNVGAGCDDNTYAFEYSAYSTKKSNLGCGIVVNDKEAYFVPMNN